MNEKERTGAVLSCEKWVNKTLTPEHDTFVTIEVKLEKSGATPRTGGGLDVKIRSIDVHGSLVVDLIDSGIQ